MSDSTAHLAQWLKWRYAPVVEITSTADADALVKRFGFPSVTHFLRPFATVVEQVSIRGMHDAPTQIEGLQVRMLPSERMREIDPAARSYYLQKWLKDTVGAAERSRWERQLLPALAELARVERPPYFATAAAMSTRGAAGDAQATGESAVDGGAAARAAAGSGVAVLKAATPAWFSAFAREYAHAVRHAAFDNMDFSIANFVVISTAEVTRVVSQQVGLPPQAVAMQAAAAATMLVQRHLEAARTAPQPKWVQISVDRANVTRCVLILHDAQVALPSDVLDAVQSRLQADVCGTAGVALTLRLNLPGSPPEPDEVVRALWEGANEPYRMDDYFSALDVERRRIQQERLAALQLAQQRQQSGGVDAARAGQAPPPPLSPEGLTEAAAAALADVPLATLAPFGDRITVSRRDLEELQRGIFYVLKTFVFAYIDRRLRVLSQFIADNRQSTLGRFASTFFNNEKPKLPTFEADAPEPRYRYDSLELSMRRCGDLCMAVYDWNSAVYFYKLARDEFKSTLRDRSFNRVYLAAAKECLAVALLMQGRLPLPSTPAELRKMDLDHARLESAREDYRAARCFSYAFRCNQLMLQQCRERHPQPAAARAAMTALNALEGQMQQPLYVAVFHEQLALSRLCVNPPVAVGHFMASGNVSSATAQQLLYGTTNAAMLLQITTNVTNGRDLLFATNAERKSDKAASAAALAGDLNGGGGTPELLALGNGALIFQVRAFVKHIIVAAIKYSEVGLTDHALRCALGAWAVLRQRRFFATSGPTQVTVATLIGNLYLRLRQPAKALGFFAAMTDEGLGGVEAMQNVIKCLRMLSATSTTFPSEKELVPPMSVGAGSTTGTDTSASIGTQASPAAAFSPQPTSSTRPAFSASTSIDTSVGVIPFCPFPAVAMNDINAACNHGVCSDAITDHFERTFRHSPDVVAALASAANPGGVGSIGAALQDVVMPGSAAATRCAAEWDRLLDDARRGFTTNQTTVYPRNITAYATAFLQQHVVLQAPATVAAVIEAAAAAAQSETSPPGAGRPAPPIPAALAAESQFLPKGHRYHVHDAGTAFKVQVAFPFRGVACTLRDVRLIVAVQNSFSNVATSPAAAEAERKKQNIRFTDLCYGISEPEVVVSGPDQRESGGEPVRVLASLAFFPTQPGLYSVVGVQFNLEGAVKNCCIFFPSIDGTLSDVNPGTLAGGAVPLYVASEYDESLLFGTAATAAHAPHVRMPKGGSVVAPLDPFSTGGHGGHSGGHHDDEESARYLHLFPTRADRRRMYLNRLGTPREALCASASAAIAPISASASASTTSADAAPTSSHTVGFQQLPDDSIGGGAVFTIPRYHHTYINVVVKHPTPQLELSFDPPLPTAVRNGEIVRTQLCIRNTSDAAIAEQVSVYFGECAGHMISIVDAADDAGHHEGSGSTATAHANDGGFELVWQRREPRDADGSSNSGGFLRLVWRATNVPSSDLSPTTTNSSSPGRTYTADAESQCVLRPGEEVRATVLIRFAATLTPKAMRTQALPTANDGADMDPTSASAAGAVACGSLAAGVIDDKSRTSAPLREFVMQNPLLLALAPDGALAPRPSGAAPRIVPGSPTALRSASPAGRTFAGAVPNSEASAEEVDAVHAALAASLDSSLQLANIAVMAVYRFPRPTDAVLARSMYAGAAQVRLSKLLRRIPVLPSVSLRTVVAPAPSDDAASTVTPRFVASMLITADSACSIPAGLASLEARYRERVAAESDAAALRSPTSGSSRTATPTTDGAKQRLENFMASALGEVAGSAAPATSRPPAFRIDGVALCGSGWKAIVDAAASARLTAMAETDIGIIVTPQAPVPALAYLSRCAGSVEVSAASGKVSAASTLPESATFPWELHPLVVPHARASGSAVAGVAAASDAVTQRLFFAQGGSALHWSLCGLLSGCGGLARPVPEQELAFYRDGAERAPGSPTGLTSPEITTLTPASAAAESPSFASTAAQQPPPRGGGAKESRAVHCLTSPLIPRAVTQSLAARGRGAQQHARAALTSGDGFATVDAGFAVDDDADFGSGELDALWDHVLMRNYEQDLLHLPGALPAAAVLPMLTRVRWSEVDPEHPTVVLRRGISVGVLDPAAQLQVAQSAMAALGAGQQLRLHQHMAQQQRLLALRLEATRAAALGLRRLFRTVRTAPLATAMADAARDFAFNPAVLRQTLDQDAFRQVADGGALGGIMDVAAAGQVVANLQGPYEPLVVHATVVVPPQVALQAASTADAPHSSTEGGSINNGRALIPIDLHLRNISNIPVLLDVTVPPAASFGANVGMLSQVTNSSNYASVWMQQDLHVPGPSTPASGAAATGLALALVPPPSTNAEALQRRLGSGRVPATGCVYPSDSAPEVFYSGRTTVRQLRLEPSTDVNITNAVQTTNGVAQSPSPSTAVVRIYAHVHSAGRFAVVTPATFHFRGVGIAPTEPTTTVDGASNTMALPSFGVTGVAAPTQIPRRPVVVLGASTPLFVDVLAAARAQAGEKAASPPPAMSAAVPVPVDVTTAASPPATSPAAIRLRKRTTSFAVAALTAREPDVLAGTLSGTSNAASPEPAIPPTAAATGGGTAVVARRRGRTTSRVFRKPDGSFGVLFTAAAGLDRAASCSAPAVPPAALPAVATASIAQLVAPTPNVQSTRLVAVNTPAFETLAVQAPAVAAGGTRRPTAFQASSSDDNDDAAAAATTANPPAVGVAVVAGAFGAFGSREPTSSTAGVVSPTRPVGVMPRFGDDAANSSSGTGSATSSHKSSPQRMGLQREASADSTGAVVDGSGGAAAALAGVSVKPDLDALFGGLSSAAAVAPAPVSKNAFIYSDDDSSSETSSRGNTQQFATQNGPVVDPFAATFAATTSGILGAPAVATAVGGTSSPARRRGSSSRASSTGSMEAHTGAVGAPQRASVQPWADAPLPADDGNGAAASAEAQAFVGTTTIRRDDAGDDSDASVKAREQRAAARRRVAEA